jgi:hypothetical protein
MFGVYRVLKDGTHKYVSRSATQSEKLAREIASDLTSGQFTRPDGSIGTCRAFPHIAKKMGE